MAIMRVEFLSQRDLQDVREIPSRSGISTHENLVRSALETVLHGVDEVSAILEGERHLQVEVRDRDFEAQHAVMRNIGMLIPRGRLQTISYDHPYVGEHI